MEAVRLAFRAELRRRWRSWLAIAVLISAVMLGPVSTAGAASRTAAASDDWPMFGHDPLHSGVSPDTAIGASTAPGLARRWSQPLGTASDQPSPAVAYNAALKQTLVYYVTYTGVVSAFSASTGTLVWRRSVAPSVPPILVQPLGSLPQSKPCRVCM